jgi:hypothetical protein
MLHMLQIFPKHFQGFPMSDGRSVRHARDMCEPNLRVSGR